MAILLVEGIVILKKEKEKGNDTWNGENCLEL